MNRSKARGTAFETALVNYFRSKGWVADRLRQTGTEDEGDLAVHIPGDTLPVVIEAKAERQMNLSAYIAQAEKEAQAYAKHRDIPTTPEWLAIVKRPNKPIGQSYVVITLDEYIRQTWED